MYMKNIFKNGFVTIKKCKNGLFAFNNNDTFIGKSLDLYGEWTQKELDVLIPTISPNDIVVDVGAFIGTHTIPFAKATAPNGGVYAIETQRMSFAFLNTNIVLNNLMNVITLNKFASDKLGKIKTLTLDQNYPQNFGSYSNKKLKSGEIIDTITIDSLNLTRVKLIKIDVEGNEKKVIIGASKTIKKFKPILYVECTNPKKTRDLISQIFKLNYKAYWHISSYYNPNNYYAQKKNIFEKFHPEVNLICFPKESSITQNIFIEVVDTNDTWKKAYDRRLKVNKKE